jgi:hypothetical protein
MRKKQDSFLDVEAMKMGFQRMLREVNTQLESGQLTEPIKALLSDRKKHIEQRLEALK